MFIPTSDLRKHDARRCKPPSRASLSQRKRSLQFVRTVSGNCLVDRRLSVCDLIDVIAVGRILIIIFPWWVFGGVLGWVLGWVLRSTPTHQLLIVRRRFKRFGWVLGCFFKSYPQNSFQLLYDTTGISKKARF